MARSKVRVKLNGAGIEAMLQGSGIRLDMLERAERVAEMARRICPVVTGAYRDSIFAYDVTTDRAVGRVSALVDYATTVEANTGTLGVSLDAAG